VVILWVVLLWVVNWVAQWVDILWVVNWVVQWVDILKWVVLLWVVILWVVLLWVVNWVAQWVAILKIRVAIQWVVILKIRVDIKWVGIHKWVAILTGKNLSTLITQTTIINNLTFPQLESDLKKKDSFAKLQLLLGVHPQILLGN